jgi:hypothetical protein
LAADRPEQLTPTSGVIAAQEHARFGFAAILK